MGRVGKYLFVKISERQREGIFLLKERCGGTVLGLFQAVMKKIAENKERFFLELKKFLFNSFYDFYKEKRGLILLVRKYPLVDVARDFMKFLSECSYSIDEAEIVSKLPVKKKPCRFRKDYQFFARLVIDYFILHPEEFFDSFGNE